MGASFTKEVEKIKTNVKESVKEFLNTKSEPADEKLKVTVFYESECSDCTKFFRDQLHPNYESFANYIILNFVPYGKATQKKDARGNYKFDCQHGKLECDENKLQACAIDKLSEKPSSVLDQFIICYMSKDNKGPAGEKCAEQYKIDFNEIKSYAESKAGDEQLAKMGDRTHNFQPEVNWVPTIVFNDVYNRDDSMKAAQNLKEVLCEKLNYGPKICKK